MAASDRSLDAPLTPEWAVLLAGARGHLTIAQQSRFAGAVSRPLDWTRVLELALHHDVAPLLLRSLSTIPLPPGIPASVLTTLRRARAANALRNTLLFDDLARVLAWTHRRQIGVIVLKGAALAHSVYGDCALRPMRDVDLLVRAADVVAMEAVLRCNGYALDPEWARVKGWHRTHGYHLAYYKRSDGLPTACVELHWHLEPPSRPFEIDLEGVWARAATATIAGVSTRTLSPEDALLHLCLHACKHKLTGSLRSYCDIAELVRCYAARLEWTTVTRRAGQWCIGAFVHVPLSLARDLLDAPVPDVVLERLVPASFERDLVRIAKQELAEHPLDAALFSDFYDLTRATRGAARTQVLTKVLAPDAVAAQFGLRRGSPWIWWRYPQRVAHLCRSYGPAFWQFLRRGRRRARTQAGHRSRLTRFLQPFEPVKWPVATERPGDRVVTSPVKPAVW